MGATLRLVGPSLPYAAIITSYVLIIRRLKVAGLVCCWSPQHSGVQEAGDQLRPALALHAGHPPPRLPLPAGALRGVSCGDLPDHPDLLRSATPHHQPGLATKRPPELLEVPQPRYLRLSLLLLATSNRERECSLVSADPDFPCGESYVALLQVTRHIYTTYLILNPRGGRRSG